MKKLSHSDRYKIWRSLSWLGVDSGSVKMLSKEFKISTRTVYKIGRMGLSDFDVSKKHQLALERQKECEKIERFKNYEREVYLNMEWLMTKMGMSEREAQDHLGLTVIQGF